MTKVLKTINLRVLKVSSNQSNRTFTIRENGLKYRTGRMTLEEFEESEYMTGNDWIQFLKTDASYYQVK